MRRARWHVAARARAATGGMVNQFYMFSGENVGRQRLPRQICPNEAIAPYSDTAALGADWHRRLSDKLGVRWPAVGVAGDTRGATLTAPCARVARGGALASQLPPSHYLWHYYLASDEAVLLLTDMDVWYFKPRTFAILWRIPLAVLTRYSGTDDVLDLIVDSVRCLLRCARKDGCKFDPNAGPG